MNKKLHTKIKLPNKDYQVLSKLKNCQTVLKKF